MNAMTKTLSDRPLYLVLACIAVTWAGFAAAGLALIDMAMEYRMIVELVVSPYAGEALSLGVAIVALLLANALVWPVIAMLGFLSWVMPAGQRSLDADPSTQDQRFAGELTTAVN